MFRLVPGLPEAHAGQALDAAAVALRGGASDETELVGVGSERNVVDLGIRRIGPLGRAVDHDERLEPGSDDRLDLPVEPFPLVPGIGVVAGVELRAPSLLSGGRDVPPVQERPEDDPVLERPEDDRAVLARAGELELTTRPIDHSAGRNPVSSGPLASALGAGTARQQTTRTSPIRQRERVRRTRDRVARSASGIDEPRLARASTMPAAMPDSMRIVQA